jgi:amino acid adenylation domain-containing protein
VMVGFCMDKSKWSVVAILGILRAGGAVVPLGVSNPLARVETILKDTAAPFAIVDEAQERRLGILESDTKLININSFFDAVPSAEEDVPLNEPCTSVRPNNTAWCQFTSGSTGTPKGVILEHRALSTSIYVHSQRFGLQPGERLLQFAAFTFDAAIYDILAPLSFGGCTCMPSEHDRMNRLGPFISEANVTFAFMTPAVVSLLHPKDVPTIKTLIVGGEVCTSKTIDQWIEQADVKEAYGPAECSIYSTCNDLLDSSQVRNIGKAVAVRTWVINPFSDGQLVPISTPGELLIEGPLLARGYLNDPEKTAGSFLVDPAFVKELGLSPGRRFYRTGDLVQQNADGTLQYLDRIGTQVKINGQRLEIGEIESQIILLLPNAKYAYVCKRGSSLIGVIEATSSTNHSAVTGSHSIVTPDREQQKGFEYIEASLRERLPSYMIPSAFLVINSFPLTDNGKLDRRRIVNLLDAIPSDKWLEYTARSQIYYAPVGRNEEILSELWAACVNIEKKSVSRMDNFFDLGGDSITAMSLVQRLAKLGLRIHVSEIFKNPVLCAMAAQVTTDTNKNREYERFSLVSSEERARVVESVLADGCIKAESDVTDILPTTAFQAQIVRENLSPARRQLNHFASDATGPCDTSHLTSAIIELVTKIESLRTGFAQTHDQKLLQVVYANWEPTVRVFKTDKSPGAYYEETPERDMFTEPSLAQPMFDVAIIITETTQQARIVFRMSHALYDGATLHQVWAALEAIMAGQTIGNFAPVGPYFQSLQSETTNETEDYWGELVQGAALSSVSTRAEPRVSRLGIVSSKPIMLPRIRQFDFTLAVAVKTAWAIVLSHHVASNDVVFADILTGRTIVHPSVADVVACCARAVPCRVTCEPEWTAKRLIEQIKQQQVDSMAHEGLELQQIAQRFMGWSEEVESDAPDMRVSMVNHTKAQKQNMSLGSTIYERVAVDLSTSYASVDFAIESVEQGDGSLSLGMAYASDRISEQLARTLSDRVQAVLMEIIEDSGCNVSHLYEILGDSAMEQ